MINQILAIVGPTGTGKTARAIELSKRQPSILISADSRQVYRGMDIVTGKDHPQNITIFGIDLVDPDQPASVSVWYDSVYPYISQARGEGKQVIVVGGTGLYLKALTEGIETMQVPIDHSLRLELATLSITKLQDRLHEIDPARIDRLNHSDLNNPRRLMRAIEIGTYNHKNPNLLAAKRSTTQPPSSLIKGLRYADDSKYKEVIRQRVIDRLEQGAIEETVSLLKRYPKDLQSMTAIGYKSIIAYLEGSFSQDQMVEAWVADELSYAKRQLTWFRKQPTIWYDVDTIGD